VFCGRVRLFQIGDLKGVKDCSVSARENDFLKARLVLFFCRADLRRAAVRKLRAPRQDKAEQQTWMRGQTPFVEYTHKPDEPPLPRKLTKAGLSKQRRADARLRRAMVDAWCDPARARKDLLAAGSAYADLRDAQGLANAFVAHAQTRIADAHLAEWDSQLSLPASNMAREEYAQAHKLFSALLDDMPRHYSAPRQHPVHAVTTGQRMRPYPLSLSADDAKPASIGL
jgi:hypothetical protein